MLFGKPYSEHFYYQCLAASELTSDIAILPSGDETEIGEKGINLRYVPIRMSLVVINKQRSVVDKSSVYLVLEQCIKMLMYTSWMLLYLLLTLMLEVYVMCNSCGVH